MFEDVKHKELIIIGAVLLFGLFLVLGGFCAFAQGLAPASGFLAPEAEETPETFTHPSQFMPGACSYSIEYSDSGPDYDVTTYDVDCGRINSEQILEYIHEDLTMMGYLADWFEHEEDMMAYAAYSKYNSVRGYDCSTIEMTFQDGYIDQMKIENQGTC